MKYAFVIIAAVFFTGCGMFRQTVVETESRVEYIDRPVVTPEVRRFFDVIISDTLRLEDSRVRLDMRRYTMPDSTERIQVEATCKPDTIKIEMPVRTVTNTVKETEYRIPWYVWLIAGVLLIVMVALVVRR